MSWPREETAARAVRELADADYVNLGTGTPTLVPRYVVGDIGIALQSENGILDTGPYAIPWSIRHGSTEVRALRATWARSPVQDVAQ